MALAGIILAVMLAAAVVALWLQLRRVRQRIGHYGLSQATFEQSPRAAVLLDAATLRVVAVNTAFIRESGYSPDELHGISAMLLFVGEASQNALSVQLRGPVPHVALTIRLRRRDWSLVEVDLVGHRVRVNGQDALSYTCQDISVRARLEAQVLEKQQHFDHLAHHDPLTGMPNRLYLTTHLPAALQAAERKGQSLAVLSLDLDRFKHINDSCGHEAGDELLKIVAQRLRSILQEDDIVVRMGGDEFVVILQAIQDVAQLDATAQRIAKSLSDPAVIEGRPLVTTASIGMSLYPRDGENMDELLRHADSAMYQAKERGRNNCQVFSPLMDRRLKQRIALETHLRLAIGSDQLDVHYQPIVDLESNQVVALEALMRWNHPSHGFISPAKFISIAEESGLIVPLGDFVLERVLSDVSRWRADNCQLVPIAVNVSAIQLQRSNLPGTLPLLLEKYDLDCRFLQIELTETTIFERREAGNGEANEDVVTKLRDLGIHISIDDFGTGYSSLSYLKRWPVDSLKIDRSFVSDLASDASDLAIVGAIIAMAQHLRVPVIAEGIEYWEQLDKLRELGCALGQGYLFSKPVPARHCKRFLQGKPLDLVDARQVAKKTG